MECFKRLNSVIFSANCGVNTHQNFLYFVWIMWIIIASAVFIICLIMICRRIYRSINHFYNNFVNLQVRATENTIYADDVEMAMMNM